MRSDNAGCVENAVDASCLPLLTAAFIGFTMNIGAVDLPT